MSGEIVNFGKYKGQPAELLATDKDYVDWLIGQSWFKERYQRLYAFVTALQTPEETPEHNFLQAKFLDDDYCFNFFKFIKKGLIENLNKIAESSENNLENEIINFNNNKHKSEHELRLCKIKSSCSIKRSFESFGFDVCLKFLGEPYFKIQEMRLDANNKPGWLDIHPLDISQALIRKISSQELSLFRGLDERFYIELKPSIGDDYPSILRQVKKSQNYEVRDGRNITKHFLQPVIVVTETYTGVGATFEQVKKIFDLDNITLIKTSDYIF